MPTPDPDDAVPVAPSPKYKLETPDLHNSAKPYLRGREGGSDVRVEDARRPGGSHAPPKDGPKPLTPPRAPGAR